jgi:hypothetical protein
VICGAFVTFWNQISSFKFFAKIIPTSISVIRRGGREFLLSTLFGLDLKTSSERPVVTFFFFTWAGDLFFDFEDKNFAKLGTSLLGGSGNLNCMCSFKRWCL